MPSEASTGDNRKTVTRIDIVGGGLDLFHPFGADVGYQRPLLDVVGEDCLAPRLIKGRVNVGEKAHPGDRLDVLIDDRFVERLAGLRSDVDADRVLFNALVTDDADAGDYRGRLRTETLRRQHQRHQQENRMDQALPWAAPRAQIHQSPSHLCEARPS